MENRINIKIRNERSKRVRCSLRIFHNNTKDDHSYTKGRQPPQRLQPRIRQLPGDIPRHRFSLCAAAPKRYDYTIGYVNTVVSRACAELRLQSKNADKDTDCILISVLIWARQRGWTPSGGKRKPRPMRLSVPPWMPTFPRMALRPFQRRESHEPRH